MIRTWPMIGSAGGPGGRFEGLRPLMNQVARIIPTNRMYNETAIMTGECRNRPEIVSIMHLRSQAPDQPRGIESLRHPLAGLSRRLCKLLDWTDLHRFFPFSEPHRRHYLNQHSQPLAKYVACRKVLRIKSIAPVARDLIGFLRR